jgi:hypothetical protein
VDALTGPLVQCGWCPEIMCNDMTVVLLHFAEVHRVTNGSHSVRYITGSDWDVAELDERAGGGSPS